MVGLQLKATSLIPRLEPQSPDLCNFYYFVLQIMCLSFLSAQLTKGRSFSLPLITIKNSCHILAKCSCYLGLSGRAASYLCSFTILVALVFFVSPFPGLEPLTPGLRSSRSASGPGFRADPVRRRASHPKTCPRFRRFRFRLRFRRRKQLKRSITS